MSSLPPIDFPTSDLEDLEMDGPPQDGSTEEQSMSIAPQRLFLEGTPSAAGTPARQQYEAHAAASSPLTGIAARRAVGSSTPRRQPRTPLFAPDDSSSPLAFPSSSSVKTPRKRVTIDSDPPAPGSSEPLAFPSSPAPATTPAKLRRGDIRSSFVLPTATPRQARRTYNPDMSDNLRSDGTRMSIPFSSAPTFSAPVLPSEEPDQVRAIWGITVNIAETMKLFRDFLRGFKPKYRVRRDREQNLRTRTFSSPEEGEVVLYETYLRIMRQTGQTNLNLDMVNLLMYPSSKKLFTQLQKYPEEVVPAMDQVLKDLVLELAEEDQNSGMEGMQGDQGDEEIVMAKVYRVRPFVLKAINMRDFNPTGQCNSTMLLALANLLFVDTDELICIEGLIIRATPVIPEMKVAFFRCLKCSHTVQVEIDRETPDSVPDGQTPHTVTLSVYDEMVDVAKPGDRIIVTGVYRSVPVRVNPRQRTMRSLFKTYLDVVHTRLGADGALAFDRSTRPAAGDRMPRVGDSGGAEDPEFEDCIAGGHRRRTRKAELEAKLIEISRRHDGMDDVKKGVLLQLFGGTNKNIVRGGGGGGPRYRGDINVLLVGDPGTSKSQILQYVHKIAPRGVYASGKGSSAVGLTAYITRDHDSKRLVLESGALVLSDGGVCCLDEFDKMPDGTRSVLHEVMEQQTVSIAKAGIITTLNARTSILAAANPVESRYNVNLPVTRNIDLPPTLISRFDLLYLVLDQVDETLDRKLAQHLVWESRWRVLLCDALSTESGIQSPDAWAALVGILVVIESERLYTPSSTVRTGNQNTTANRAPESALIAACIDHDRERRSNLGLKRHVHCNSGGGYSRHVTRIEYNVSYRLTSFDLVAMPAFPYGQRMLSSDCVRTFSTITPRPARYTRTSSPFLLLSSFTLPDSVLHSLPVSAHDAMVNRLSSHLSSLARVLRMALTPTQSTELGPAILDKLRSACKVYATERDSNQRIGKRRNTCDKIIPAEERADAERSKCYSQAAAFSLVARVSGTVLASSLIRCVHARHSVFRSRMGRSWEIGVEYRLGMYKTWTSGGEQEDLDGDDGLGTDEVVASAALQFLYDVRARFIRIDSSPTLVTLGQSDVLGSDEVEELLRVVRGESTAAELVLEIIRTLFTQVSQTHGFQHAQAGTIIRRSIDILSRKFSPTSRWCGSSAALTQENLGVALLYVLVHQWMGVNDTVTWEEVLLKFASLLLSIPLEPPVEATDKTVDLAHTLTSLPTTSPTTSFSML
ncbi:MCM2/3/5 family-domain-containing protein [Pisolithus microcarpus]|nr:MCM2/3/5 family-domain-containing protein [Pisolithus microcarpus]